jgi:hypothetical protein
MRRRTATLGKVAVGQPVRTHVEDVLQDGGAPFGDLVVGEAGADSRPIDRP